MTPAQPPVRARREKVTEWVSRGRYAVAVEVEAVYPVDDPSEPCFEPETVRFLEEVARRADAGDLAYLQRIGKVYEQLETR